MMIDVPIWDFRTMVFLLNAKRKKNLNWISLKKKHQILNERNWTARNGVPLDASGVVSW